MFDRARRDEALNQFTAQQSCEYIDVQLDEDQFRIFENGASIRLFDNMRRGSVADCLMAGPFDEEALVKRKLRYFTAKHEDEYQRFTQFQVQIAEQAELFLSTAYAANSMTVPPPPAGAIAIAEAGKARCDRLAITVAELQAKLLSMPSYVAEEERKARAKADHEASKQRCREIKSAVASFKVARPDSLKHHGISVSMHL